MCEFKSAVVDRTGHVWMHDLADSHSDLITLFGLRDDDADAVQCVEYMPPQGQPILPFGWSAWTFKLDNERCSWWTDEMQERVIAEMQAWFAARVVPDDDKEHLVIGKFALAGGNALVRCTFAQVRAYGSAQVRAYGSALVEASGSAQVRAYGSAQVRASSGVLVTPCTCGRCNVKVTRV